ncbi:hypothetical protein FSP39_012054 [Pinctada imbricata]|uniref:Reverse transcriptase domain-containing protein n=1 Tax=Pinctada imbricata TaxID=66713 RepID=A0AA89C3D9_PINIB|nr:hypothetical protein FSP39_012054 [Pinctada imbricata]
METLDIIGISEHWLRTQNANFLQSLDSQFESVVRIRDSKCTRGMGGVAILYRKSLTSCARIFDTECDYVAAITLKISGFSEIAIICTRLPSSNVSTDEYILNCNHLFDIYDAMNSSSYVILMGDLNADINQYHTNTRAKILRDKMSERGIIDIMRMQNHIGPKYSYRNKSETSTSLIDYIMIPKYVTNFVRKPTTHNISFEISDHLPISCEFHMDLLKEIKSHNLVKLKWDKADRIQKLLYSTEIASVLNEDIVIEPTQKSIDDTYHLLVNTLHSSAYKAIPSGQYRPYLKPFWKTDGLGDLHYKMRASRRIWKQNGRPRNSDSSIREQYKEAKKEFRKNFRSSSQSWESKTYDDLMRYAETDIGTFFRAVKSKRKKKENDSEIEYKGIRGITPKEKCLVWEQYYKDLMSENNSAEFDEEFKEEVDYEISEIERNSYVEDDHFLKEKITRSEITDVVKNLKLSKSPGPDLITNEHIIYAGLPVASFLARLFNAIVDSKCIPSLFKSGVIIPIYKGKNKDKTMPSNYRGITLTSAIGKVFEKVIMNRIQNSSILGPNAFPHAQQFGFSKGRGASTAAYTLQECIDLYQTRNSPIFVCFLDNEKAFDNIWQNGLFHKLHSIGILGKTWRIIRNTYTNSINYISQSGEQSDVIPVNKGVGQGRVMSAWMFLVFIDDLLYQLNDSGCGIEAFSHFISSIILADDTTLIASAPKSLQKLLDIAYEYARKWRLSYNASKSTILAYGSSNCITCPLKLGQQAVPIGTQTTFAGSLFSISSDKTLRIEKASAKAKQLFHSLYDMGLRKDGMNPLCSMKIWERIILPSAMYSVEIWGNIQAPEMEILERAQRYFVKRILGLTKTTPKEATCSLLGAVSLESYIDKLKLMFVGRLCNADIGLLHKNIFLCQLIEYMLGFSNICDTTKSLISTICKYDLSEYILNYVSNGMFPVAKMWKLIVQNKVLQKEEDKWSQNVCSRSELLRFFFIQRELKPNKVVLLSYIFPECSKTLLYMLKLISLPKCSAMCEKCDCIVSDYILYVLIQCQSYVSEQDKLFDIVVNVLPVQKSILFFDQNDEEIVQNLLGGLTDVMIDIDDETYTEFILNVSSFLEKWNFKLPIPYITTPT